MATSFAPYLGAATITLTAGAIATAVHAQVHVPTPMGMGGMGGMGAPGGVPTPHAMPPAAALAPPPVAPGAHGFGPTEPSLTQPLPPGINAPGYAGSYGGAPWFNPGMSQPGQRPFPEGIYGNQGPGALMNQPGAPTYYEGFGYNRGAITNDNGAPQPVQPVPGTPPAVSPNTTNDFGFYSGMYAAPVTNNYGFYEGFGGGTPNFGFYNGFTTPR
jgi:hypothetical protein